MGDDPEALSPPVPDPPGTSDAQHAEAAEAPVTFVHDGVTFGVPEQLDWPLEALDHFALEQANDLLRIVLGAQFDRWRPGKTIKDGLALRTALLGAIGTGPGESSASAAS